MGSPSVAAQPHDEDNRDESLGEAKPKQRQHADFEFFSDIETTESEREDDHHHEAPELTPELLVSIMKQVEFYFSDANLPTDKKLLKLIRKTAEGWVPVKQFVNFRKVRAMTRDVDAICQALQQSDLLVVSPDLKNVRKKHAVPHYDIAEIQSRMLVVEGLPGTSTIDSVADLFREYGAIRVVRLCLKESRAKLPGWLAAGCTIPGEHHAFVEFEEEASVVKAAAAVYDCLDSRHMLKIARLVTNLQLATSTESSARHPASPALAAARRDNRRSVDMMGPRESRGGGGSNRTSMSPASRTMPGGIRRSVDHASDPHHHAHHPRDGPGRWGPTDHQHHGDRSGGGADSSSWFHSDVPLQQQQQQQQLQQALGSAAAGGSREAPAGALSSELARQLSLIAEGDEARERKKSQEQRDRSSGRQQQQQQQQPSAGRGAARAAAEGAGSAFRPGSEAIAIPSSGGDRRGRAAGGGGSSLPVGMGGMHFVGSPAGAGTPPRPHKAKGKAVRRTQQSEGGAGGSSTGQDDTGGSAGEWTVVEHHHHDAQHQQHRGQAPRGHDVPSHGRERQAKGGSRRGSIDVGAEQGGRERRTRRSSTGNADAGAEGPSRGDSEGGAAGSVGKKKLSKRDYAAWAAATPEYRAEAAHAHASKSGQAKDEQSSLSTGGAAHAHEHPSHSHFVHGEATIHAVHTSKGPDGTRGFGMGRGRPLQPPPA